MLKSCCLCASILRVNNRVPAASGAYHYNLQRLVIYAPIYTISSYARLAYNLIKSADNLLLMPTTVSLISLKIMHGSSG